MAPDADLVICPFMQMDKGVEDNVNALAYRVMQSILYIRDYAKRVGKPYIISMSLNSQEGPHDGTSLGASMLEQLACESTNMVMASSNEGDNLNYISGTYEGNDTLHTVISGIPIAYAFSRKAGDMTFQIGIIDWETKTETWRSQPLSSANGGCSFRFMLNDSDDKTTPYEDIREHLAEITTGKITFSISTMEDGRAKLFIAAMATPAKHRFSFHITCPDNNTVDMWGDGAEFNKLSGSDYYTEGVTSMSMGDFVTGGTIISVGSWTSKTEFVNINGEVVGDDYPGANDVVGQYSYFSSYGTDLAGHNHPYISAPGNFIISALNHFDPYFEQEGARYKDVVAKDADNFIWGAQSGTSMATPTVAGIIALWLEARPDLTYDQIRETLAATATKDEFTEAVPIRYGHGKIDAYKGLLHVLNLPTSIPTLSLHQPKGVTFSMKNDRLFIEGADDGTPIRIYTTDGLLVASAPLTEGCVSLPNGSPAGVYAVQVGTLGSTLIRAQ